MLFAILALICFVLAVFGVHFLVNLIALGLAFLALHFIADLWPYRRGQ